MSYQEIATHEGVEISTVESLLWRARQALKREYAALSGGTPVALVLAAGTVRRLTGRLARRVAMLPVGRGGGVSGSLAVALTSAAVVTVAFLPAGTRTRPAWPAAVATGALAAPAAPAVGARAAAPPTAVAPAESPGSTSVATPQLPGVPGGGAVPSATPRPGVSVPGTPPPQGASATSTAGIATPETLDPAVSAVSGLTPGLAPAPGVVASATTQAVTDLAESVTSSVLEPVGSALSAAGDLVSGNPSLLGVAVPSATGGSTTSAPGHTAGGLLSSLP